jgi:hypothetical protein
VRDQYHCSGTDLTVTTIEIATSHLTLPKERVIDLTTSLPIRLHHTLTNGIMTKSASSPFKVMIRNSFFLFGLKFKHQLEQSTIRFVLHRETVSHFHHLNSHQHLSPLNPELTSLSSTILHFVVQFTGLIYDMSFLSFNTSMCEVPGGVESDIDMIGKRAIAGMLWYLFLNRQFFT